ncbi:MAG: hypothetical protein M3153_06465 [Chloroflexota bacterium]|nr:hypothetical protein [Chloroflexota bacterium]
MTQRPSVSDVATRPGPAGEPPPPDVVSFIRFCHHRRGVGWPELYDEMCGVAARREFHGWDHADLASRGLTFSLFEMPRLAGWVRTVVDGAAEGREAGDRRGAIAPGPQPHGAVA